MELLTKDSDSLMTVEKLSRDGNNLMIEGQIMGTLPVRALLTPAQARSGLKLLNFKTIIFLITLLFRSDGK